MDTAARYALNNHFSRTINGEYLGLFDQTTVRPVLHFQQTHELYTHTPYISLPALANHLHVQSIHVKDEAHRFGLQAFKVMGGIYAVGKYVASKIDRHITDVSFATLQSDEVRQKIGETTFISATDGNHGKGIAWAARELGQKSVIYLPKGSTQARLEAIQNEGAHAEITDLNYDDTVRMCAELAEKNHWVLVQDTAWEGYEDIPLWIMQGYAGIAEEIIETAEARNEQAPTHIFLQAGVGSFAASIAAYMTHYYRDQPPKIIIVEPDLADCYYRSFKDGNGDIVPVTGHLHSIMAGLCCGEPNTLAFDMLKQYAYAAFSCADHLAALGMRVLGNPLQGDEPVISGESGAIPLGLLYDIQKMAPPEMAEAIGIDASSRIMMINTEGDTDPTHYREVVWHGPHPNPSSSNR